MEFFVGILINGICVGALYGVGAIGFVIIFKSSQVFNLAHGALIGFGAFLVILANVTWGLPLWLAILIGMLATMCLAAATQSTVMQPLCGQPLMTQLMATVGIMSILCGLIFIIWGSKSYAFSQDIIIPIGTITFGNTRIAPHYPNALILSLIMLAILLAYSQFSKSGLAMRGMADDMQLAQSIGIPARIILATSWGLAGMTAALAGAIFGTLTLVDYTMPEIVLKVLPVVVLGGMESYTGCIIGGMIMGLIVILTGSYLGTVLPGFQDVAPFLAMLLILLFKPYGLFGEVRIERV